MKRPARLPGRNLQDAVLDFVHAEHVACQCSATGHKPFLIMPLAEPCASLCHVSVCSADTALADTADGKKGYLPQITTWRRLGEGGEEVAARILAFGWQLVHLSHRTLNSACPHKAILTFEVL